MRAGLEGIYLFTNLAYLPNSTIEIIQPGSNDNNLNPTGSIDSDIEIHKFIQNGIGKIILFQERLTL